MHQLLELSIRTWQAERSRALGRQATLDDLEDACIDAWVEQGFTWLYLHGLWPSGPKVRAVALADASLRQHLAGVMPDQADADIVGWTLAPCRGDVAAELGGDAALARLRDRCRAAGLSLMLDFVPNHVGLDHPWLDQHPGWFVRGSADDLARQPHAWFRHGEHILAHGRDPFFAPWRETAQLDYSHPEVKAAMIAVAERIAGRCDGVRCDMAMLLLPDVFLGTWGRRMEPFWGDCLAAVRKLHPGTLFMAEVYWNREYELQQAGFDFTYDKILYDRLLIGDAEGIRGHLRAASDYQRHCVRFLENHEEQRAAARFPNPEHHRGALFIAGMVPGMLLLHDGQEQGLTQHQPLTLNRRPADTPSSAHARAYAELMHLLGEHARQHGVWRLLEPRDLGGRSFIGCYWNQTSHAGLLVVVNASWSASDGALDGTAIAGTHTRDLQLTDCFDSAQAITLAPATLREQGLRLALPPWGARAFRVMPARSARTAALA